MKSLCLLASIFLMDMSYAQGWLEDPYRSFENKDYKSSSEKFNEMRLDQPDDFNLDYNHGVSSYKEGNYSEAVRSLKEAAESNDLEIAKKSLFNLGNAYAMQQKFDKAIESYDKALELDPDYKPALENKGFVEQVKEQKKQDQDNQDKQDKDKDNKDKKDQEQENKEDQQKQDQQKKDQQEQDSKDGSKKDQQKQEQGSPKDQGDDKGKEEKAEEQQEEAQKSQEKTEKEEAKKAQQEAEQEAEQAQKEEKDLQQDGSAGEEAEEAQEKGKDQFKFDEQKFEKQQAQKLIRSIEDKISQYRYKPTKEEVYKARKLKKDW